MLEAIRYNNQKKYHWDSDNQKSVNLNTYCNINNQG